jgi:hypothetical protein
MGTHEDLNGKKYQHHTLIDSGDTSMPVQIRRWVNWILRTDKSGEEEKVTRIQKMVSRII